MTQDGEDRVDNNHVFNDWGRCTRPCIMCGLECFESSMMADAGCAGCVDICPNPLTLDDEDEEEDEDEDEDEEEFDEEEFCCSSDECDSCEGCAR